MAAVFLRQSSVGRVDMMAIVNKCRGGDKVSNYVHNYLLCDNTAKERILSLDREDLYILNGFYNKTVTIIDKNRFLIIFDTRGKEYRTEFIRGFIRKFHSTKWYCIEENEIKQGCYFWNGCDVEFSERKLIETLGKNEITIRYSDSEYRPLYIIFISQNQIVFENILNNELKRYGISENSNLFINCYMNFLLGGEKKDFIEYLIPFIDGIQKTISIYWDNKSFCIETFKEVDEKQLNGERIFDEMIYLFNNILSYEGIEETISFDLQDII